LHLRPFPLAVVETRFLQVISQRCDQLLQVVRLYSEVCALSEVL
jgi:hypothetical protein